MRMPTVAGNSVVLSGARSIHQVGLYYTKKWGIPTLQTAYNSLGLALDSCSGGSQVLKPQEADWGCLSLATPLPSTAPLSPSSPSVGKGRGAQKKTGGVLSWNPGEWEELAEEGAMHGGASGNRRSSTSPVVHHIASLLGAHRNEVWVCSEARNSSLVHQKYWYTSPWSINMGSTFRVFFN